MSPTLVERDPDSEFVDAAPEWLSRFVRHEVRPLLVQHRRSALDALIRWFAFHVEQLNERRAFEARRREFLEHQPAVPADTRNIPDRSAEGLVLIIGGIAGGVDANGAFDGSPRRTVYAWGPPELHADSMPSLDLPLPPPRNRDLSTDECWTGLLAIHDAIWDPRERLLPTDDFIDAEVFGRVVEGRRSCHGRVNVGILTSAVRHLTEAQLPDLRAMLMTASATVASGDATSAAVEQLPGPVPAAANDDGKALCEDPLAKLRDLNTASASEIATAIGQSLKNRVEPFLRKLRDSIPACYFEIEADAKRATDPTYLYRIVEILTELEKALARWRLKK